MKCLNAEAIWENAGDGRGEDMISRKKGKVEYQARDRGTGRRRIKGELGERFRAKKKKKRGCAARLNMSRPDRSRKRRGMYSLHSTRGTVGGRGEICVD